MMPSIAFSWPPDRSYFYTLLVVSQLSAKLLHLGSHIPAVPVFLFLLYLPTFLLPDAAVVLVSRVVFQRWRGVGVATSLVITSASAAQIGFFIETGGEIRWEMMAKVLREPEGFAGMLMTGFAGLMAVVGVMAGLAWLLNPWVYNLAARVLKALFSTLWPRSGCVELFAEPNRNAYVSLLGSDHMGNVELMDSSEEVAQPRRLSEKWEVRIARAKLAVVVGVVVVLQLVRPKSPYGHMSTTLPFTLFDGLFSSKSPLCNPQPWEMSGAFPLQELIEEKFWIPPKEEGGIGRGWSPGSPWWEVDRRKPGWLPEKMVPGFAKYYRRHGHHHHPPPPPPPPPHHRPGLDDVPPPSRPPPRASGYDSVLDPLKISNLDQPVLEGIRAALKDSKVPIKHVVLLSLESTRKDVFPLVKGDTLEKVLKESRDADTRKPDEYAQLSELSKTAEMVTGEDMHFGRKVNQTHGGVNIHGALTGSTFTLKSMLGSHCGVSPLPVDFLEELETEIYQPCIPQILKVMNAQEANSTLDGEWAWKNFPWKSAFMQASTNKFDRQQPFLEQLGFDYTLVREDLQAKDAKYPPKNEELNYFGYSEKELKPYIKDLFEDAEKNGERVFLSHLTSSTHHPWATPKEFGEQQRYWGGSRGGGTPWDRYLNSIKWGDQWIGEFLRLLEDVGVADKTLVVMVGDHGFSFGDDSTAKTTYANAHINSFRVPLVFYHPQLPRMQLNATVTSMSILPTILDLLVESSSLSAPLTTIASDLLPEYEAQTLIRPFLPSRNGREAWNFGVVNPGGTHLSIVSAAVPFRLVMPVCEPSAYAFSHLDLDPAEAATVKDWEGGGKLRLKVRARYGDDAARWVERAERVGTWMVWEGRRRWGYWDGARREDRGAAHSGDGVLGHDHWWET